jgi:hypothetical protein
MNVLRQGTKLASSSSTIVITRNENGRQNINEAAW